MQQLFADVRELVLHFSERVIGVFSQLGLLLHKALNKGTLWEVGNAVLDAFVDVAMEGLLSVDDHRLYLRRDGVDGLVLDVDLSSVSHEGSHSGKTLVVGEVAGALFSEVKDILIVVHVLGDMTIATQVLLTFFTEYQDLLVLLAATHILVRLLFHTLDYLHFPLSFFKPPHYPSFPPSFPP